MSDRAATFQSHRPTLLSLAYRLLGSVADADDVVQEAFVRFQTALLFECVAMGVDLPDGGVLARATRSRGR